MKSRRVQVVWVVLALIILFSFLYIWTKSNAVEPGAVVLPAISKRVANGMVKENECYIVRVANPEKMGSGGWYYRDGSEMKFIRLMGKHPVFELSYVFSEADRNSFLVKGYVDEAVTEYYGKLSFYVEEWYIIAPIKRDYGSKEYREEQRLFSPRNYLDTYDVEQGDYHPYATYDLVWNTSNYYLEQSGYYKIRSRLNVNVLEWFLVDDETEYPRYIDGETRQFEDGHMETKIQITGNLPEYSLHAAILNNGYDDQDCKEYFVVRGELKADKNGGVVLEIFKWWINSPFYYKDDTGKMINSHKRS